jgi:hypothetical protein
MENQWTKKVEELERFRAEVKRLVEKADRELILGSNNHRDIIFTILSGLNRLVHDHGLGEPAPVTRYEKTYVDGRKCMEEVCDDGVFLE